MLAALVLLGTSVGAQAQKVSLNMNSTTISKAMSALHKQTGYSFVYNADALRTDRKISVHATDLRQAVDQIIDGSGLEYGIRDKNIILRKKVNGSSNANQRTQQSKNRTVKGRVTDSNGDPIIGQPLRSKAPTLVQSVIWMVISLLTPPKVTSWKFPTSDSQTKS